MLSAIAGINQAIERGNATELLNCLKDMAAKLEHIDDDSVNRYLEQLVAVKKEKGQVFLYSIFPLLFPLLPLPFPFSHL